MSRVSFESVSLHFPIYSAKSMSLRHQLLRVGTGGTIEKDAANVLLVKSLSDVSFELHDGDCVGLVGHNGAGKSTLLKTIAGIYQPTAGRVVRQGRVSTVFEIGAGIDPELSGEENIVRMALFQGASLREANARLDEIAEFTELGDFLNLPVRTYSAGMTMRLMFGVATAIEPEILLVDEMLSAGDAAFQERALARMEQLARESKLFVLASHSEDLVKRMCNRVLRFEHGELISDTRLFRAK